MSQIEWTDIQCVIIDSYFLDMASSSTNSSIKSDDQNNKSNQSSQTSDGSKEVLAASTIVEKTVKQQRVGFIGHSRSGIYNSNFC
jgi:hypothetical protein